MDIPESAILALITSVCGGVGIAFKALYDRITKAADQCEKDRNLLWIKADELSGKVKDLEERLEDCPAPERPVKPKHKPRPTDDPHGLHPLLYRRTLP